ncbi:ribonuclease Y [Mesoplasma chauliocola]|uniref:Ribonuclease Y n=1 Tax=Mesoplasma chauliocola TaxID=216427 RepID=A0A249SMQ4_9MOLU|nr:ribonuclease Y [Mesoplasma chauliocola]ASZ08964.1 ribonuclease Y [Mesoplasma chauliocola]
MGTIIGLVIISVAFIIALTSLLYILFSRSQKVLNAKKIKEAKLERKKILSETYREINEQKKSFEENLKFEKNKLEIAKQNIENENKLLAKERAIIQKQQESLDIKNTDLDKRINDFSIKREELIERLEVISNMTSFQAKEELMKNVESKIQYEIVSQIKQAENLAHSRSKEISNNIILSAMERFTTDIVNEKTTNLVKLPNDEIKGWIIGKDGRNLKTFEQLAGVEIIIDDTPEVVTISSFNPIRREIATKTLEKLLIDKRIQPIKIEKELKNQQILIDETILETGYEVMDELNIHDMDKELVRLVGKLKYRTSYGQNVLLHSIEVAKIASAIAAELGLNSKLALRAGLLHDIGKAIDFEKTGSHVFLGVEAARKYGEEEIIINSIEAHHEDVPKESEIAIIVAIADTISASKPGARNNSIEDFIVRMKEIEKIGNSIPGIAKTYAFQAGRQIRVIVDPVTTDDKDLVGILEKLKNDLKNSVIIPGEITITAIREKREILVFN